MRFFDGWVTKKLRRSKFLLKPLLLHATLPDGYRWKLPKAVVRIYDYLKLLYIAKNVIHIFGPKAISCYPQEAIVLCLVKNGGVWIKDFIEHYFRKGFKHIIFLDNGSTDKTLQIAKKYRQISVLQTKIPFKNNNILLRRYLVKRFGKSRWSLTVDIDELWDYPFSDKVSLKNLLLYLEKRGANAVIAQMLEMFRAYIPLKTMDTLQLYAYYDISNIKKIGLTTEEALKEISFLNKGNLNRNIKIYKGGIRAQLFGLKDIMLTKMPLLFYDDTLQPLLHQHFSDKVSIADVSSVLLHYKFTHLFKKQVQNAVRLEQYAYESSEYKKYLQALRNNSRLELKTPAAKKLISINQLIREDFLIVSPAYLEMVRSLNRKS